MKDFLILLLTLALLAAQFHWGSRKKRLLGALFPTAIALVITVGSFVGQTMEYVPAGLLCVLALTAVWVAGRINSRRYEEAQIKKMRSRDI